ncbi:MAG TPA: ABC transporter permease [Actinomycetota bacterium]|nr:ABC transporter permease [Actinomycetota bacterium]
MIRRTLFMVLVLFIVSLVTFIIFVKLPSVDPAIRAAGRHPTPQLLRTIRHQFGLDRPIWVQYWRFAKGLIPWPGWFLNREVYFSWSSRVAINEQIYSRLPVTAALTIGSAAIWLLMGIPVGIVSAVKPGSLLDRSAMIAALVGVSAPDFWLGLVFLYVFHFWLHVAPTSGIPIGMSTIGAVLHGYFVLPWLTLASTSAAFYSRMTRSNLMDSISQDYIRTARAKGLSERRVIYKHGLRGALTPVVTMLGLDVAFLLGGAVVTESVFQLPGLGQYALQALYLSDFPAVMGVTVLGALFIVVANLVVDIVYAFLDPRVRYD